MQASRRTSIPTQVEHLDFKAVYDEYVRFVWRILRGLGVPDAMVADAAQDVFIVVHRRLSEFGGRSSVKTWLFAIAYRVSFKYRRTLQRAREHATVDDSLRDERPGPVENAEGHEAERLMMALLDRLDERKRIVLVLTEFEELSGPEISAITGFGLSTVYTLLRRARIQLNREFAVSQQRRP